MKGAGPVCTKNNIRLWFTIIVNHSLTLFLETLHQLSSNSVIIWQVMLSKRLLAYHFCSVIDSESLSLTHYLVSLTNQLINHRVIGEAYQKLLPHKLPTSVRYRNVFLGSKYFPDPTQLWSSNQICLIWTIITPRSLREPWEMVVSHVNLLPKLRRASVEMFLMICVEF